jgi:hypothetical protein
MKKLFFLMLFLAFLSSCQNSSDKSGQHVTSSAEAQAFKTTIENYFLESKKTLQNIVDKFTKDILVVTNDTNAKVDTKGLRILLDSARNALSVRIDKLEKLTEVDEEIGVKRKEIIYLKLFDSAFKNEFYECINLLDSNNDVRHVQIPNKMEPILLKIKEAELVLLQANKDFIKKYNLANSEALNDVSIPHIQLSSLKCYYAVLNKLDRKGKYRI